MRNIVYILCFFVFYSCSEDRYVELEPVVYFPETWKKNIRVYTLLSLEGETIDKDTTYFGSAVPDSLTFTYDDNKFVRNFLVDGDQGVSIESDSGQFILDSDSLILFGNNDTLRYRLIDKNDSLLIIDREVLLTNYVKNYTTQYQIVNSNTEYQVSFSQDIYSAIFYNDGNGKCMPCHSTGTLYPVELEELSTAYTDLLSGYNQNGDAYINVLQPEESYLYKQITNQTEPMMPTPSSDRGPLNQYEINTVLKWIEQGAKNN